MPKTFTDDVAPLLPSAVKGPFQVVDPADPTSYFKVDPALARVEAAGAARPRRRLTLGMTRGNGVSSLTTIDTAMDARSVALNSDGGFYTFPFQIPTDMDVGASSDIRVALSPGADGGGGTVVRLELVTAYGKDGDPSVVTETLTYDWTTPSGWSMQDLKLVRIDAGSGYTHAGGKFETGDYVGLLVRRVGSAAQDTFPQSLLIGASVVFEYTAKEL